VATQTLVAAGKVRIDGSLSPDISVGTFQVERTATGEHEITIRATTTARACFC
jgi:hypothetical protein